MPWKEISWGKSFISLNQTFDNPDQEFNFSLSYDYQRDNERELLALDTTILYQNMNTINIDLSYKHPLNEKSKVELGYDGKINDNIPPGKGWINK